MLKALQRVFSLFGITSPPPKKEKRKPFGQSLVEVAIAFPVLIMLFSGVVEFGFILNYYLSLLDATRESARLYSGGDPFDATLFVAPHGSDVFYYEAAFDVQRILDPKIDKPSWKGRRIVLDPDVDDVIVSVYSADFINAATDTDAGPDDSIGHEVTNRRQKIVLGVLEDAPYHLFPPSDPPAPDKTSGNYPSMFTAWDIWNTRVCGAPNEGILIVEVHYNYSHVLGLPWMKAVLPDPLHLRAYTIMPLRAAEPDDTSPDPQICL